MFTIIRTPCAILLHKGLCRLHCFGKEVVVFRHKKFKLGKRIECQDNFNVTGIILRAGNKFHASRGSFFRREANAFYSIMNPLISHRNVLALTERTYDFIFFIIRQFLFQRKPELTLNAAKAMTSAV